MNVKNRYSRREMEQLGMPVGDPFGGPAYGQKTDLATASAGMSLLGGAESLFGGSGGQQMDPNVMRDMADPFWRSRGQYQDQLQNLMNNPGSVQNLPGYQFQMQQGTQAVERGMAATGQRQSGAEQVALQEVGQGVASSFYDKQLHTLMGLSGANANPGQGANAYMGANEWNMGLNQQNQANTMGGLGMMGGAIRSLQGIYGGNTGSNSAIGPYGSTQMNTNTGFGFDNVGPQG